MTEAYPQLKAQLCQNLPPQERDFYLLSRGYPEEIQRFEEESRSRSQHHVVLIHDMLLVMSYLFAKVPGHRLRFSFLSRFHRACFLNAFPRLEKQISVLRLPVPSKVARPRAQLGHTPAKRTVDRSL